MAPSEVTGRRVGAAILDLFLYAVVCAAIFFAMAESSPGPVYLDSPQFNFRTSDTIYYVDGSAASIFWTITLAIGLLQFGVLPGLSGWTPGKLATGLRVRAVDGSRVGVARNLLRAFLWVVDGFPYFVPGLVGFVMVLSRSDRRRIADLAAETVVADKAWTGQPAPPLAPAWLPEPGPEAPR